ANPESPIPDHGASWPDHHDVGGLGELHPEPGARDLVDAVGLGPRRLLELQAAEVDVELVPRVFELRQLHEQLPVLMARTDHADRGDHVGDDQDGDDEAGHCRSSVASFSATRRTALRARGLPASSVESALRAPPIARSVGTKPSVSGRRRLPAGAFAWRAMKRLTMRSSSEWKLITARRPPGLSAASAASSPASRSPSSRLTWMRIAWNERVAGWISFCPGLARGITEAISSASCAVRVIGCSARRATMARAMRRHMRSSPYCHSTSAISASPARAS